MLCHPACGCAKRAIFGLWEGTRAAAPCSSPWEAALGRCKWSGRHVHLRTYTYILLLRHWLEISVPRCWFNESIDETWKFAKSADPFFCLSSFWPVFLGTISDLWGMSKLRNVQTNWFIILTANITHRGDTSSTRDLSSWVTWSSPWPCRWLLQHASQGGQKAGRAGGPTQHPGMFLRACPRAYSQEQLVSTFDVLTPWYKHLGERCTAARRRLCLERSPGSCIKNAPSPPGLLLCSCISRPVPHMPCTIGTEIPASQAVPLQASQLFYLQAVNTQGARKCG